MFFPSLNFRNNWTRFLCEKDMFSRQHLFVISVYLASLVTNTQLVEFECDWSVERDQCPMYGTFDWHCLQVKKKCGDGKVYHCVRNETERWFEVCDKGEICRKGEEPVHTDNIGIQCKPCRDPERYEPKEGIPSSRYSECTQIKSACPKDTSLECPNENGRYTENRICRCLYEKNYKPQNYDYTSDTWQCAEPDLLNCVQEVCPESVDGKKQSMGPDYKCSPAVVPVTQAQTESPRVRSTTVATQTTSTRESPNGGNGGTLVVIKVLAGIASGIGLVAGMVSLCYFFYRRKKTKLGVPRGSLAVSDIKYTKLKLSWDNPEDQKGYLVLGYYLEYLLVSAGKWKYLDTVEPDETEYIASKLSPGTKYGFRVRAVYEKGRSRPLVTDKTVSTKKFTVPSQPSGPLKISNKTSTSFTLSWKPTCEDGGKEVLEYIIEYSKVSDADWKYAGSVKYLCNRFNLQDLTPGYEYMLRVFAKNEIGKSEPLLSEEPIKLLTYPSKPCNIFIDVIKFNEVLVTWDPPENDGGSEIVNYHIGRKEEAMDWEALKRVPSGQMSVKVGGLKSGSAYHFCVTAENKVGKSEPLKTEKPIGPPGVPAGPVHLFDVSYSEAKFSWDSPAYNGGSKLTGYVIERLTGRSCWDFAKIQPETRICHAKNLNAGSRYCFHIRAINLCGRGLPHLVEFKTKEKTVVPSKPESLQTTETKEGGLILSWKPPKKDGGSVIINYHIYQLINGSLQRIDSVDSRINEYSVQNLTTGIKYRFEVLAENSVGYGEPAETRKSIGGFFSKLSPSRKEEKSETLSSDEQALAAAQDNREVVQSTSFPDQGRPSAPIGPLRAVDVDERELMLQWNPPEFDGHCKIDRYIVKQKEYGTDFWNAVGIIPFGVNELHVEDLTKGKKYEFSVEAENSIGASIPLVTEAYVQTKTLIVPFPPCGPLGISDCTNNSVTLTWEPVKKGYPSVTSYLIKYRDRAEGTEFWKEAGKATGEKREWKQTDLLQGHAYLFEVTALNKKGESEPLISKEVILSSSSDGDARSSIDESNYGRSDNDVSAVNSDRLKKEEKDAFGHLQNTLTRNWSDSWEKIKVFGAHIERHMKESFMVPGSPPEQINGNTYDKWKDILPAGYRAYKISGKDSFLYRSVSFALFGDEDSTYRLRLIAFIDGMNNCELYAKQYFKNNDVEMFLDSSITKQTKDTFAQNLEQKDDCAEITVQMATRETAMIRLKCNPLQVQFLSGAINMPILQYFEGGKNYFGEPVEQYEMVKPIGLTDSIEDIENTCIRILWIHDPKFKKKGNDLNYIVPVIKKKTKWP